MHSFTDVLFSALLNNIALVAGLMWLIRMANKKLRELDEQRHTMQDMHDKQAE